MPTRYLAPTFLLLMPLLGCVDGAADDAATAGTPSAAESDVEAVALAADWDSRLTPDELSRGRLDPGWRAVVELDTTGVAGDTVPNPEDLEQISVDAVNQGPMHLPLHGDVAGPSVLRAQILLDRALFSPGIIDGMWGKNTEKAVYWFQQREGLGRTGRIDQATFERLVQVAGSSPELIVSHQLTAEDVEGPFVEIPDDIYEKAELDCMCYESLEEKLAEKFHTSVEMLAHLNPDLELGSATAGNRINVPNVRTSTAGQGAQVARLVISAQGFYVHAVDASGRILFHFPSTLGSSFDPSPSGQHRIVSITRDPWWHYQPDLLAHVDDSEPDARIPPGPNNAVGLVWMALSQPHYGVHGTSAPETIGYTTSAGCIRLTNWDALFLADRISAGVPVEFTEGGAAGTSTD